MVIASLIIGIVLVTGVFFPTFPLGAPIARLIGIAGLAFAILALRQKSSRRIAIASIVLNSLAILLFIVQLLLLATGN